MYWTETALINMFFCTEQFKDLQEATFEQHSVACNL